MNPLLVKLLAAAVTLSQALVAPDDLKTQFDADRDRGEIVRILREGCTHFRSAFKIEDIDLDGLVATAIDDPEAASARFHGISFTDLHQAYRLLCNGEKVEWKIDESAIIEFYNQALIDLPDHVRLRDLQLPATTLIVDSEGRPFREIYQPEHRRIPIPLDKMSKHLKRAFISAEDKGFLGHQGVDERGLIRALVANMAGGALQGGSTITQQLAKNLLVGGDTTYVRKMREIAIALRIERNLSKSEILELYLNAIFLGRGSWGVEMAARTYFGKSADALELGEAAFLAGLVKGPSLYGAERHLARAIERQRYVLGRMKEDGWITDAEMHTAKSQPLPLVQYTRPSRDHGFHFVDYISREAKDVADARLTDQPYEIRSTINSQLQRAAEAALQEGLATYELRHGRAKFEAAEANLGQLVRRIESTDRSPADTPAWQRALNRARLPLYDVHWVPAVVLSGGRDGRRFQSITVGLKDGRTLPLSLTTRARLEPFDVVMVNVVERRGRTVSELRVRPQVQGAVVVLDNKSGGILAMAGGFSYPLSQLNRVSQAHRQPGSAIKPLTYLAALAKGLQPNTLVRDTPITLPPIGNGLRNKPEHYWSPANYDGGSSGGSITLRRALEKSRNLATAHLMAEGLADNPEGGLDKVCNLALEAQVYRQCARYYPFVLGAQPVRPLDLARFYAAIANEGLLPTPHAIQSITHNGTQVYQHSAELKRIAAADAPAFYQLKSIMQGVVRAGTAARISELAPYIAGKTGTTDDSNDVWFVGFSNEVTIAVWVGYDNADGKRRNLGGGATGGNVALPIFKPIMQAAWIHHAPRTVLAPPSEEAAKYLVSTGGRSARGRNLKGRFVEYLRRGANGKAMDAQYALVGKRLPYSRPVQKTPDLIPVWERSVDAFAYEPNFGSGQNWFTRNGSTRNEPRQDRTWRQHRKSWDGPPNQTRGHFGF